MQQNRTENGKDESDMRYKQRKCGNRQHIGTVVLKIQVKK